MRILRHKLNSVFLMGRTQAISKPPSGCSTGRTLPLSMSRHIFVMATRWKTNLIIRLTINPWRNLAWLCWKKCPIIPLWVWLLLLKCWVLRRRLLLPSYSRHWDATRSFSGIGQRQKDILYLWARREWIKDSHYFSLKLIAERRRGGAMWRL